MGHKVWSVPEENRLYMQIKNLELPNIWRYIDKIQKEVNHLKKGFVCIEDFTETGFKIPANFELFAPDIYEDYKTFMQAALDLGLKKIIRIVDPASYVLYKMQRWEFEQNYPIETVYSMKRTKPERVWADSEENRLYLKVVQPELEKIWAFVDEIQEEIKHLKKDFVCVFDLTGAQTKSPPNIDLLAPDIYEGYKTFIQVSFERGMKKLIKVLDPISYVVYKIVQYDFIRQFPIDVVYCMEQAKADTSSPS